MSLVYMSHVSDIYATHVCVFIHVSDARASSEVALPVRRFDAHIIVPACLLHMSVMSLIYMSHVPYIYGPSCECV